MNWPCGVQVPAENVHCLHMPRYIVKSVNRINNIYIYLQLTAHLLLRHVLADNNRETADTKGHLILKRIIVNCAW